MTAPSTNPCHECKITINGKLSSCYIRWKGLAALSREKRDLAFYIQEALQPEAGNKQLDPYYAAYREFERGLLILLLKVKPKRLLKEVDYATVIKLIEKTNAGIDTLKQKQVAVLQRNMIRVAKRHLQQQVCS